MVGKGLNLGPDYDEWICNGTFECVARLHWF